MTETQLRDITTGDAEWLAAAHGALYRRDEGFDDSFEALVAEIVFDFLRNRGPGERAFIAEIDGAPVGSVFCVRHNADEAQLRLFLLLPHARGHGLGRRMLRACMAFARHSGYRRMTLWTHKSHAAACALYASEGWHCADMRAVVSFGVALEEQHWQVVL